MSSSAIQDYYDRKDDGEFIPMHPDRLEEMEAEFRAKNPDERWNINTGKFEPNFAAL